MVGVECQVLEGTQERTLRERKTAMLGHVLSVVFLLSPSVLTGMCCTLESIRV
jgi:hypothetical protein